MIAAVEMDPDRRWQRADNERKAKQTPKIHRKIQGILRGKNARKRDEYCKIRTKATASCVPAHEKTYMHASCAHVSHSMRPAHDCKASGASQGSNIRVSRQMISLILMFSLGYDFILFCNNVCCHVKLNLFWLGFQDEPLLIC